MITAILQCYAVNSFVRYYYTVNTFDNYTTDKITAVLQNYAIDNTISYYNTLNIVDNK